MTHKVNANGLNLRAASNASAQVLRVLSRDCQVRELRRDGSWVQVEVLDGSKATGWVAGSYLVVVPAAAPAKQLIPLTEAERHWLLGEIKYVRAQTKSDPEAITITNNWQRENVVEAVIPQLRGVPMWGTLKSDGRVWVHKKVKAQLLGLFAAWEKAGLLHLVKTWGGCYNPRLIRGSTKTLSNHAHASAFDINMEWNGLGKTPAAAGKPGSVRDLIPLAHEFGFFWGGDFRSRPDGMHFEVAEIRG